MRFRPFGKEKTSAGAITTNHDHHQMTNAYSGEDDLISALEDEFQQFQAKLSSVYMAKAVQLNSQGKSKLSERLNRAITALNQANRETLSSQELQARTQQSLPVWVDQEVVEIKHDSSHIHQQSVSKRDEFDIRQQILNHKKELQQCQSEAWSLGFWDEEWVYQCYSCSNKFSTVWRPGICPNCKKENPFPKEKRKRQ